MSSEAAKAIDKKTLWGGKISPFSISYGKMMMWFFLISDALTFGGLLTAVGFFRHKYSAIWPSSEDVFHAFPLTGHAHLPLMYVALMTFILIVSSVTMVLAVEAGHRMDKKGVVKWLTYTIIGGAFFLLSQVWEWSHFIHGTDLGAIEVRSTSLNDDGIPYNVLNNGVIAQWTNKSGDRLEYYEQIKGTPEQIGELKHLTHQLHNSSEYSRKELSKINSSFKELMIQLDLNLMMPAVNNEGKHYIVEGAEAQKLITEGNPIFGANLSGNQYGAKQYSQFFFFVTGFHGFHVFSGVIVNIIVLLGASKGVYHERGHYEMVEKTGLYWHFIDLVWVFVFTFFYLV